MSKIKDYLLDLEEVQQETTQECVGKQITESPEQCNGLPF